MMAPLCDPTRPRVAIVTPVYNEVANLPRYAEEVRRVLLDRADIDATVVLVDDGSSDKSWKLIADLCCVDRRFRGIRLSRNFGAHAALSAGFLNLDESVDAVVVLAADLQDPPDVASAFIDTWRNGGADIVWGVRRSRRDVRWRQLASRLFEASLRRWAMPSGSQFVTGSFLLMDRRVLSAIRQMPERNRITFALVAWTGFDQIRIPYERAERQAGSSGWRLRRMLKTMYDAFVGFSVLPIRLMKGAAMVASTAALGMILYLVVAATSHSTAPGWASQMLLLSLFFGIQFGLTALVGEYLARIYTESLGRPFFVISRDTAEVPSHAARRP